MGHRQHTVAEVAAGRQLELEEREEWAAEEPDAAGIAAMVCQGLRTRVVVAVVRLDHRIRAARVDQESSVSVMRTVTPLHLRQPALLR